MPAALRAAGGDGHARAPQQAAAWDGGTGAGGRAGGEQTAMTGSGRRGRGRCPARGRGRTGPWVVRVAQGRSQKDCALYMTTECKGII